MFVFVKALCHLLFKKCKIWAKEWLQHQEMLGVYKTIVSEVKLQDHYHKFILVCIFYFL